MIVNIARFPDTDLYVSFFGLPMWHSSHERSSAIVVLAESPVWPPASSTLSGGVLQVGQKDIVMQSRHKPE